MRADMHKVVIERPRWNPGPPKFGRRANLPEELLPKYEGMRRPYAKRKGFTDLLGPLERWLRSQTGRLWNDVYSEACAVIKPDSVVRAHIKTHLLQFVERDTFMHDGEVCILGTWRGKPIPVENARYYSHGRFYVHPETEVLLEITSTYRTRERAKRLEKREAGERWLTRDCLLKQVEGIWYSCQIKDVTGWFEQEHDLLAGRKIGYKEAYARYGRPARCVLKRQLSHSDLKRFELKNTVVVEVAERSLQVVVVTG